jgi:mono/diheme cytochrome c family protein
MSEQNKIDHCPTPPGEPTATQSTLPMWIVVALMLLLFVGAVEFDRHSGWFNASIYGPYASVDQLELYQPVSGAAAAAAHGKQVYEFVCGTCHGPDGMGKPGMYPPLAGSEWVNAKQSHRLAHIPLEGLAGQVQVKGQTWNLNMAAMGAGLSDADLAAVLTYIRSSWGNKGDEVTADEVKAVRASLGASPKQLSGDELKTLPE